MNLLWKKDAPIIESLLETDVYKILMLNDYVRNWKNMTARFRFMNRTDVDLLKYVDLHELREQLAAVASLRFTEDEINHLNGWQMFHSEFGTYLQGLSLQVPEVGIDARGKLSIEAGGRLCEVTLWEIYTLAIVSELYVKGRAKVDGITERQLFDAGHARLMEKIQFLKKFNFLRASQFGLRRRAGALLERHVTKVFLNETSFLTGVSNIQVARENGVEAQGTNGHEEPMVAYAYARGKSNFDARDSVYQVLRNWQALYGQKALIMLPDAFGTDAFLKKLPDGFAHDWRGFRHDSGDPFEFGEKIIRFYIENGIDSTKKTIIFSDGLTMGKILALYERFTGRIKVAFGIGTDLTNDLVILKPLSLVMKVIEADGRPTVKLSDNIAKATGDAREIEEAKRIFGYTTTFREEVRV